MRNSGLKLVIVIFLLAIISFTSGCMPRHTDTLVFGTNTKLAVDLSLNSTTNVPSLTVGYTRQEGVWMPLYVNAKDSRFANNTGSSVFRNFTGVSTHKYVGNAGGDRDTYSVLASFGADIKNGSEGAGVGIAQYFATGLAARELAKKGGAELVTLQAQGRVSDEIKQAAAKQLANWNYKIDLIAAYVDEDGIVKKERLEKLIKNTGLGNTFVEEFKGKPIDDFKKSLHSPLFLGNVDGLAASISK